MRQKDDYEPFDKFILLIEENLKKLTSPLTISVKLVDDQLYVNGFLFKKPKRWFLEFTEESYKKTMDQTNDVFGIWREYELAKIISEEICYRMLDINPFKEKK